jgi:ferric-dicitrate binding protein FerR (iron transport regulator)
MAGIFFLTPAELLNFHVYSNYQQIIPYKMKRQAFKDALFNFFSRNATPLQKKVIEEWLEEEENREWFFEFLKEWENTHPQFVADTDLAFERLKTKVQSNPSLPRVILSPQLNGQHRKKWFTAASVCLLLALSSWFLKDYILYKTYSTAFGEVRTFTLKDGSRVVLNANSSLRVRQFSFGEAHREVYLTGEAEFLVKHTADHQKFIVKTPDKLSIEVLGTQFVVYSRPRGSKVILQSGTVRVSNASNQSLTIVPGDILTLDTTGVFQKNSAQSVQTYASWKTGRFVFNHTSLKEITQLIEENFGVKVYTADSALANRSITGTLQVSNVKEMLEMLCDISNLQVTEHNQAFILSAQE